MLKTVFMGTPDFVMPALETLYENSELKLVVTGKDKKAGRGKKKLIQPEPKSFSIEKNIPYLQINSAKDENLSIELNLLKPDLIIVFAFGFILPENVFSVPGLGTINIHTSILPKYRGASPIYQALLNMDKSTGVSFQKITQKLDSGDILFTKSVEISENDDYFSLNKSLSKLSAEALKEFLVLIEKNKLALMPQDEKKATYCKKITKNDAEFAWNMDKEKIMSMIKAFAKWPVAYTITGLGKLRIYKAISRELEEKISPGTIVSADKNGFCVACNNGAICILEIQPENKRRMDYISFLNGHRLKIGEKL